MNTLQKAQVPMYESVLTAQEIASPLQNQAIQGTHSSVIFKLSTDDRFYFITQHIRTVKTAIFIGSTIITDTTPIETSGINLNFQHIT